MTISEELMTARFPSILFDCERKRDESSVPSISHRRPSVVTVASVSAIMERSIPEGASNEMLPEEKIIVSESMNQRSGGLIVRNAASIDSVWSSLPSPPPMR